MKGEKSLTRWDSGPLLILSLQFEFFVIITCQYLKAKLLSLRYVFPLLEPFHEWLRSLIADISYFGIWIGEYLFPLPLLDQIRWAFTLLIVFQRLLNGDLLRALDGCIQWHCKVNWVLISVKYQCVFSLDQSLLCLPCLIVMESHLHLSWA